MRFRAIIITLILLSSMLVIQGRAASPTPDIAFQIPEGDWVIGSGESITIEGETVELRGNLTVESGGSLTLRDHAKLIINSSYNGEYWIRVKEGGNFNVIDSEVSAPEKEYSGKIDYNLKKGMNFISIPFERDNNSVESVLSPIKGRYYKAYIYDASDSNDPWKFYTPGMNAEHADEMPEYTWSFQTKNITPLTLPENGAENINISQKIYVIFNKTMNSEPQLNVISGTDPGNWSFEGWLTTFLPNDTAMWSHDDFAENTTITLAVNYTYTDALHSYEYKWSFKTGNPAGGYVESSSPYFSEKNVNLTQNLTVVFHTPRNSSWTPEIKQIYPEKDFNWTFLGWNATTYPDDTAVWGHDPFPPSSRIWIAVYNHTDQLPNLPPGMTYYLSFLTEPTQDLSPPEVREVYPLKNDSFVPSTAPVYVVFNESMNTSVEPIISQDAGYDPGNWTFLGWQSTYLANDTAVWSHDPWKDFENITLSVYNYTDPEGNTGALYSWSFRTGDGKTPRIKEIWPDKFSTVSPDEQVRVVFDSSMNTAVVPEISSIDSNISMNWTFLGWQSTYLPHDTAVWGHENWSSDEKITLRISNYSDLSEIYPYDGIFVYLYSNYSFTLSGVVEQDVSKTLYSRPNAIAYPFLDNATVKEVLASVSPYINKITTYYGDNETSLNDSDIMEPGKAYWIYANSNCLWSVSAYSLLELESIFPKFAWKYENGSSGNVQNSLISGCGFDKDSPGVMIFSDLVKIGNTEIKNSYAGIYIEDASPILSDNNIHRAHYGIISQDASPILSGNDIYDTKDCGISIYGGFPIVSSNTVSFNTGDGMSISDSVSILDSNKIESNDGDGIFIHNSTVSIYSSSMKYNKKAIDSEFSNITVQGSTMSGNQFGICASSSEVDIKENDFSLNRYDISMENRSSGRIENNSMSSSERSHISCENGSSPRIYGNIIISGDSGIYVSASNPLIEKNIIGQNRGSGIQLQKGSDPRIKNNVITNNGWAGVYVDSSSPVIENNTLSTNDFGIASFNATPEIRNNTITNNRWYGLSLIYSDADVENTVLLMNKWYGILTSYSIFTIKNVTISNSTYQLYLTHSSSGTSINSTISQEKSHLDASSILYVKYFLNIYANDSLENLVSNATYTIKDRDDYTISSGKIHYGKVLCIPLISYVRTFAGTVDLHNPYNLSVSRGAQEFNRSFFLNSTLTENFSFEAETYSVKEDCGRRYLFDIYDWIPRVENATFYVNGTSYTGYELDNGSFFIEPLKDWNGDARITIMEKKDNRTIGKYTALIHVLPVNDPPRLEGENPTYSSTEEVVFRITYVDVENSLPSYIRVVINGKAYDMFPANPGDFNTADGKTYEYRANLPEGTYTYYFICSDGENATSTEEMELTVRPAFALPMWAVYALLLLGMLVVLYVAVKIRRLKRMAGVEIESAVSEKAEKNPSEITSPAGMKRTIRRRKRSSGIDTTDIGINKSPLDIKSKIDREPVVNVSPISAVTAEEKKESEGKIPEEIHETSEKEDVKKKYGRSAYIEMQKKHRKLRVLLEDREKYAKISPEQGEEKEIPTAEDSVNEILRTLKGEE